VRLIYNFERGKSIKTLLLDRDKKYTIIINKMRKSLLITLMAVLTACQENTLSSKQTDYVGHVTNLEATYHGAFAVAMKSTSNTRYTVTYDYLRNNYFSGSLQINSTEFGSQVASQKRASSIDDLDLSFLSEEQIILVAPFLNNILSQTDLSNADKLTDSFNNDIVLSALDEEHKYQLLAIGASIKAGIKIIEDASVQADSNGRVERVNVKGALQAGVIGLVGGAVVGAKAGCAGGTVAFPGLGTATGCVGGAVIGGALGFIGGVAESIVQDLIFGS